MQDTQLGEVRANAHREPDRGGRPYCKGDECESDEDETRTVTLYLVDKINEQLAFGPRQGSDYSRGVIYKEQSDRGLFDNLRVASITPDRAAYQASGTLTLNTQLTGAPASGNGSDVAIWGLGDTEHFAWQHHTDGIATGYEAAGPGTFDVLSKSRAPAWPRVST